MKPFSELIAGYLSKSLVQAFSRVSRPWGNWELLFLGPTKYSCRETNRRLLFSCLDFATQIQVNYSNNQIFYSFESILVCCLRSAPQLWCLYRRMFLRDWWPDEQQSWSSSGKRGVEASRSSKIKAYGWNQTSENNKWGHSRAARPL